MHFYVVSFHFWHSIQDTEGGETVGFCQFCRFLPSCSVFHPLSVNFCIWCTARVLSYPFECHLSQSEGKMTAFSLEWPKPLLKVNKCELGLNPTGPKPLPFLCTACVLFPPRDSGAQPMKSPFVDITAQMASLLSLATSSLKRQKEPTTQEALPVVKNKTKQKTTPPNFCQGHQLKYVHVAHLVPNQPTIVHSKTEYCVSYAFWIVRCHATWTGCYPLIHLLPAANITNHLSNLLTDSPLSLGSHHFKRALREGADSPYVWNSGSVWHTSNVLKMEAPLSTSTPWLPTAQGSPCYFPSSLDSFSRPQPSSGSHSNSVITDSCHLMWTSRNFEWEGSGHSQPKHWMSCFWCPEVCSLDTQFQGCLLQK